MGKSTATAHLLWEHAERFDLVVAFVGSANCNPVLEALMARYWDPRFFFSEWNVRLIDRLLEQQERGAGRNVLILVDDVVLSSKAQEQISTLAMRGRHFRCSLWCAAVSYVTLPKQVRRSLDILMVFSLPMKGDLKVLTWEYTSNTRVAEFALQRLKQHECLVLQTLTKKQSLSLWTATRVTAQMVGNTALRACDVLRSRASPARPVARSPRCRSGRTASPQSRTPQEECAGPGEAQTGSGCSPPGSGSADEDRGSAPVSTEPTRSESEG